MLSRHTQFLRSTMLALLALFFAAFSTIASANPEVWKRQEWKKTDFTKSKVDFNSVRSGGPPRDGIPPIDKPVFKPISQITDLKDIEGVVTVAINGKARAYPLRVLMWHEIVNDTLAGKPITVTYCPLCNAAIVFDRNVDGQTLDFGTTGKLRKSDLIMWDRQSESWWQQFTGEAIVGSMVGKKLKTLPARLESWAKFKARHPGGEVLVPNDPGMRHYGRNPYVRYDLSTKPFLYSGEMPDNIEPMDRVVVVHGDKGPAAVSLKLLRTNKTMKLAGRTLSWTKGQASALERAEVHDGRDVGNVVVTKPSADGKDVDDVYDVTFAFVFHAFHPDRKIIVQ